MTTAPVRDLRSLVDAFQSITLPKPEWTHSAHLRVGAWHVAEFGADEALTRLRRNIRALNESHGGANTATGGYHETITRAYLMLLGEFIALRPESLTIEQHIDEIPNHPIAHPMALRTFYTTERLMSVTARATWVAPDLAAISLSLL